MFILSYKADCVDINLWQDINMHLLPGGGIFVGGIVLGLLLGLIITGVILFVLYKQHKITWQQNKDKYGKL